MINELIISFLRLDLKLIKLLAMLMSILCKLNKIALSVLSMSLKPNITYVLWTKLITILTMLVNLYFWYITCTNYANLTHNLVL